MDYETLIVGGAAAGSSAALVLGRCCRRVLVCDDGHPRNAGARGVHGYLSRDGIAPAEFLRIAREEVMAYPTIEWWQSHVDSVGRIDGGFQLHTADGRAATGATLLLATGLIDDLPAIPGAKTYWGRGVYVCPFCDAWEVRGQRFVVMGRTQDVFGLALELRQWSPDVVVATDGAEPFDARQITCLERLNMRVNCAKVAALMGTDERLERIQFADGNVLETSVVFLSTTQRQRSPLAENLGCPAKHDGPVAVRQADCAAADLIWIAGNASTGLQMTVIAAAEGVKAAHAINEFLAMRAVQGC